MDLNVKRSNGDKEKGTLKCRGCDEPHLLRECPHNPRYVQNIQVSYETTIVNELLMNMPRIRIALEDRKSKNQYTMIEIEGIISNQPISILSYIGREMVEKCKLKT